MQGCAKPCAHAGAQVGVGKGLESLAGRGCRVAGSSPAAPMADDGGHGLWRARVRERRKRGFIGPTTRRGDFARVAWPTGAMAWARGGWRRAAAGGQSREAVRAPASVERPRGTGLDR
jgi:hypothetical protein